MKDRILLIGARGYLGSHLLNILVQDYDVEIFEGVVENILNFEKYMQHDFSYIFHFGSPNDDSNLQKLESLEIGTRNCIAFANQQKAKLIYASTKGIMMEYKNKYEQLKKNCTVEVRHSAASYVCLLIPRVYSRDRNHGLIKSIKDGKSLDSKNIVYLTIHEFIHQTLKSMKLKNICYNYNNLTIKSIDEIKNWIL